MEQLAKLSKTPELYSSSYTQITFHSEFYAPEWMEVFVNECSDAGALAISMEDANADTPDEHAIYGEPGCETVTGWLKCNITIILDESLSANIFLQQLQEITYLDTLPPYTINTLADQDWVSLTQSQFEPIHVNDILSIYPSWYVEDLQNTNENTNTKHSIQLDPGLGFGTGKHATTYLCLDWLSLHIPSNKINSLSLLDYGCGSGILAIAAAKLGAHKVVGVDIDVQAVESSIFNAQNNNVDIDFYTTENIGINNDNANYNQYFNIVVANILCNPLQQLCAQLYNYVNIDGHLVLSGILTPQIEDIKNTYAPYIQMNVWKIQEDWVCMVGKKIA